MEMWYLWYNFKQWNTLLCSLMHCQNTAHLMLQYLNLHVLSISIRCRPSKVHYYSHCARESLSKNNFVICPHDTRGRVIQLILHGQGPGESMKAASNPLKVQNNRVHLNGSYILDKQGCTVQCSAIVFWLQLHIAQNATCMLTALVSPVHLSFSAVWTLILKCAVNISITVQFDCCHPKPSSSPFSIIWKQMSFFQHTFKMLSESPSHLMLATKAVHHSTYTLHQCSPDPRVLNPLVPAWFIASLQSLPALIEWWNRSTLQDQLIQCKAQNEV